jgi:(p)ppGpp synthase/HD superfamily hydrolase
MIVKAIEYAAIAHNGQLRKGTNIPYIVHPLTVMYYLMECNCSDNLIIAGLLHDVLEDTKASEQDLKENFGSTILEMVIFLSEPDKSRPWKERKIHTINIIKKEMPLELLYVACADKLHNLRSFSDSYSKDGEKIWSRFAASKSEQSWYYKSLANSFISRTKSFTNRKIFDSFEKEVSIFFDKVVS